MKNVCTLRTRQWANRVDVRVISSNEWNILIKNLKRWNDGEKLKSVVLSNMEEKRFLVCFFSVR